MSDLIDRQEAINTIMEDYEPDSFPDEYSDGYNDGLKSAKKSIESLPSAQQWTPCSERLPEDGIYLVYAPDYRGGSSSAKEWHDGVMFSKCKNGKWSVEHGYYSRPNCVIAWMPLPEPYVERRTDDLG